MRKKMTLILFGSTMILFFLLPTQDIDKVNLNSTFQGMSQQHLLGTDNLGRDLYSLFLGGAMRTLTVVGISTGISLVIGTLLGMMVGYYQRWMKSVVHFFSDFLLIIPSFISALIISSIFGLNPVTAGIVFGLSHMGEYVNQSAALTKRVKSLSFVQGEIALGLPDCKILIKHILPNIMRPLLTFMANKASTVTLLYASLTFIGLGADVSNPDWGTMLYQYRVYILNAPMLSLIPATGILLLCLFFHILFDDVQPENRKKGAYT
ncbi:ABC transporter permease [Paenibacillus sp. 1A_MP2]|uniref:ABC transporter permease n=1 Tax=Paenibacillus sp. 1A_MP2 TaxID=3457495 RepID=UPI003FCC4C48